MVVGCFYVGSFFYEELCCFLCTLLLLCFSSLEVLFMGMFAQASPNCSTGCSHGCVPIGVVMAVIVAIMMAVAVVPPVTAGSAMMMAVEGVV